MSNTTQPSSSKNTAPASSDTAKHAMAKEISQKWNKCTEADVFGLKNKDELVNHVIAKYGQDRLGVQKDVDAFLKGRTFG